MEKIDLKKKWKHLYAPSSKNVDVVDVPDFSFVMVDGRIEPGMEPATSTAFQNALGALYGVSYTLKFMSKLREDDPVDFTVMALEALWWTDPGEFDMTKKDEWKWTAMMMQPEHITEAMFQKAVQEFSKKKDNPALMKIRFQRFHEGLCMKIMHIGPYADEPETISKMHAFAQVHGYRLRGKHHEIYLGDPRRSKPERLKTVLRQPVEAP